MFNYPLLCIFTHFHNLKAKRAPILAYFFKITFKGWKILIQEYLQYLSASLCQNVFTDYQLIVAFVHSYSGNSLTTNQIKLIAAGKYDFYSFRPFLNQAQLLELTKRVIVHAYLFRIK